MRLTFQQRAFRAAISATLASVAIGLNGCESRSTPDGKAAQNIMDGDFQAAAKEKGVSPAIASLAAKTAAGEQVASSLAAYQSLAEQQIAVSQKLWQIGRLNLTAQRVAASASELNKYKPDAVLGELDKTVALVRGDGQKAWTVTEGVDLPTAATSKAKADGLKDKIAEIQRTLGDLKQKQERLAGTSRQLMEQSSSAAGEQAVTLFRQSADARKQANECAVQIEQTEASLVPLQQDLQVAEGQVQQFAQTIDLFAGQRGEIEKGWRGVAAQIEQRNGYAGQVYAKVDNPQFATVSLTARDLAQLTDEYGKQSLAYQQQLDGASSLVREAVASSEKALKEIPRPQGGAKASAVAALAQASLDPSAVRVLQGQIQYALGSELGGRAGLTAFQSRVAESVAQLGTALKQPVPDSMNDSARAALKTQQGEQVTKAGETLKAAGETFDTVMQSMASPDTKRAATIGRMVTLAASARVMQTAGDAATAKQTLDEAKALRDSLQEAGPLPGLPDTLQGGSAKPATSTVEKQ